MEGMAEFYSRQLSQNIRRGMEYNAEHALYNGHKVFGYAVGDDKRYVVDDSTAPFVRMMFVEYVSGKSMQSICDKLNAQGLRTTRGAKFGVKTLTKMLRNRAYIGEYHHGSTTVPGGMPALVDEALFDKVQKMFAQNKRDGSRKKASAQAVDAPRYWLTGKLYCGECGESMQGVSGTSKTGAIHYYYYCKGHRAHTCSKKNERKEWIEVAVCVVLQELLADTENLAFIAVDAAAYYKEHYRDTGYLESLEAERKNVEKQLANFVKAIAAGIFNDTTQQAMLELEERKSALDDAIEAENVRQSLYEDEHSIKAYFDKYLHADFENPETRDAVLEYFIDKIYLYDDRLVITSWYSNDKTEVFLKDIEETMSSGGFDCLLLGSTTLGAHSKGWALVLSYPKDAVMKAAFRFLDRCYVHVDIIADEFVVTLTAKPGVPIDSIVAEFTNEL